MGIKREPVDAWVIEPMQRFFGRSTTSGFMLFGAALLAVVVANSSWAEAYHHFWTQHISISFEDVSLSKNLHHWVNDGLMAIFFFAVGLELKREIIAGQLSRPKDAIMPIAAAFGGMLFPALIYLFFNSSGGEAVNGWGVPMATDIAFALGIMYLLGNRVPLSVKIFLTVLAVADDIGAVLVIAFFYTADIDLISLLVGGLLVGVLLIANYTGVRSSLFYAIVGIAGVWLAFLMSGVHATIAAVLVAFTIPARVKVSEDYFNNQINILRDKFRSAEDVSGPTVSEEQLHVLLDIRQLAKRAVTPLQRLEHILHPIVAFIVMPVFAFANAGVTVEGSFFDLFLTPVALGVFLGLLLGKMIGVTGMVFLFRKLKWGTLPSDMNTLHVFGVGMLAAIGFTMSLFVTELAFTDEAHIAEAKMGVLCASLIASIIGYIFMVQTGRITTRRAAAAAPAETREE